MNKKKVKKKKNIYKLEDDVDESCLTSWKAHRCDENDARHSKTKQQQN